MERRNVERVIFQNFKIANIKTTKDELFDSFIFELIFSFFINIRTPRTFNNFSNRKILILQIVRILFSIFQIKNFWNSLIGQLTNFQDSFNSESY